MGHKVAKLNLNSEINVIRYVATDKSKRRKTQNLSSISLGYLHTRKGSRKTKHQRVLKILFDTGCGDTIVNKHVLGNLELTETETSQWTTKTRTFTTNKKCNITFMLPAFHKHRDITWEAHVNESSQGSSRHDLITDRDLMHKLDIDILFSRASMIWDNAEVLIQSPG